MSKKTISLQLEETLLRLIEDEARSKSISKSAVIRIILLDYFKRIVNEKKNFE